jgi:hypothetical protein
MLRTFFAEQLHIIWVNAYLDEPVNAIIDKVLSGLLPRCLWIAPLQYFINGTASRFKPHLRALTAQLVPQLGTLRQISLALGWVIAYRKHPIEILRHMRQLVEHKGTRVAVRKHSIER